MENLSLIILIAQFVQTTSLLVRTISYVLILMYDAMVSTTVMI